MKNVIPSSRIIVAAVATGLIWTLMSVPAPAQGTPEQRAACQGDAQRLCGQYLPDVDRITACMAEPALRQQPLPPCNRRRQKGPFIAG
jgi:hypothetical protein